MIIDVSHNNGTIQWEKVKPNIEKAIIRLGYGSDMASQDDRQFKRNVSECKRLGIPFDFYIYSYAKTTSQAKSEAEHVKRLVGNDKSRIIYFDSEEPGTESVAKTVYDAFKKNLESAGYIVGLYASESWYKSYLKGATTKSLWIAKYGPNNGSKNTKPTVTCNLWQYSSRGKVPGISGEVDVNELLKAPKVNTPKDTKKDTNSSGYPKTEKNGVYRLYNKKSDEHFYTSAASERNKCIDNKWTYEGVGWTAPENTSVPVYRLVSSKEHFFTTSAGERDKLVKAGWKSEGVAFYSDPKKKTPVYRLYNKKTGKHIYTASNGEKDKLKKSGWDLEGVAFYGV